MRIDGWKGIAAQLNISVPKARGLRRDGLPVRKALNGRVWTTTEAIQLWAWEVIEINEHLKSWFSRPPGVALH